MSLLVTPYGDLILTLNHNKVMKQSPEEVIEALADYANVFGSHSPEFIKAFENQHRTLQQSIIRLFLQTLEYVATEDYETDLRNQASQKVAHQLIYLWKELNGKHSLPSKHLPLI